LKKIETVLLPQKAMADTKKEHTSL